jgi:hypothetical protein
MNASPIWKHLQHVQQELKAGSLETQDIAISALQDSLDTPGSVFLPSFVYPLLTNVLRFYCQNILPSIGVALADQRIVRTGFDQTLCHLSFQEQIAKDLEAQFKHLFLQLKSGAFESVDNLVTGLHEMIMTTIPRLSAGYRVYSSADAISKTLDDSLRSLRLRSGQASTGVSHASIPLLGGVRGGLEKSYHTLQKSPFTSAHVIPFFEAMIVQLPPEIKELFGYISALFWHQLHEFIQIKAVLVNPKTKEALITRLDVTTSLESKGLDTLNFESTVDDRMEQSCWNAIQAARVFLEDQFPDTLKDWSFRVSCRFPNPTAGYTDTSASLLVGLKIIGDVLDLEIDPRTVVSGEVTESGKILPVARMAEKVLTAQQAAPGDSPYPASQRWTFHDQSSGSDHRSSRPVRSRCALLR